MSTQNLGNKIKKICAKLLLTKSVAGCIIKIPAFAREGRPPLYHILLLLSIGKLYKNKGKSLVDLPF